MGGKGRFDGEIDLPGGSFSRLLLSPEADDTMFPSPSPSPLFSANTPKMLCFGDFSSDTSQHHSTTPRKPTLFNSSLSTKRRNGSGQEPELRSENNNNNGGATTATGLQTKRNERKKKNKPEMGPTPTPTPTATRTNSSAVHAKKRREKLGERITALQQLVSPYGKTDTASVLHEAMGYIRFLQDQVKVLSSPYLDCLPSSCPPHHLSENEGEKCTEDATKGLRSKGLCLVPVQCLVDINDSNGADFWASAPSATPSKP